MKQNAMISEDITYNITHAMKHNAMKHITPTPSLSSCLRSRWGDPTAHISPTACWWGHTGVWRGLGVQPHPHYPGPDHHSPGPIPHNSSSSNLKTLGQA